MGSQHDTAACRPRGRPSLYNPDLCDRILELGAKGCGRLEIAAALHVSNKTLSAWMKSHTEFREAMTLAKELEYAWWLAEGREKLADKSWNATSWALQMRNRFKTWLLDKEGASKSAAKSKREGQVNAEVLRAEIDRKLSRFASVGGAPGVSIELDDAGAGAPRS